MNKRLMIVESTQKENDTMTKNTEEELTLYYTYEGDPPTALLYDADSDGNPCSTQYLPPYDVRVSVKFFNNIGVWMHFRARFGEEVSLPGIDSKLFDGYKILFRFNAFSYSEHVVMMT